jgi:hypothetical protein
MNIRELRQSWEQQKVSFNDQLITEEDILSVIHRDLAGQAKVRRVFYNAASFLFLITFCQTC